MESTGGGLCKWAIPAEGLGSSVRCHASRCGHESITWWPMRISLSVAMATPSSQGESIEPTDCPWMKCASDGPVNVKRNRKHYPTRPHPSLHSLVTHSPVGASWELLDFFENNISIGRFICISKVSDSLENFSTANWPCQRFFNRIWTWLSF